MDFSRFDTRRYRTVSVRDGYGEWVKSYENTVRSEMDIRLLASIRSVSWAETGRAVDLACGTGRTGVWLKNGGVQEIDGVDLTAAMLEVAKQKGVYRQLLIADLRDTGLGAENYDLCIAVLADEHLSDLRPLYVEAARLTKVGCPFVIVGYHPYFLMNGIPTHFDSASGEPVAIESYVHLFSDHVRAAHAANWSLLEMHEQLVDDQWISTKPRWEQYRDRPISFAMVWRKAALMTDLRSQLVEIEADLDAHRYRPGPWNQFVLQVRRQPRRERRALAVDISRVSRKLHVRGGLRTLPVTAGIAIELLATAVGGGLLVVAYSKGTNLVALLAAGIWITTFEPLMKLLVGTAVGIRYEYAYLLGVEPRFKMRYGTYLAAPRWARIAVHLSGMVGSPLAAWVVGTLARPRLPLAAWMCTAAFWAAVLLNVLLLLLALVGVRRLGPLQLSTASGGAAAEELREAFT